MKGARTRQTRRPHFFIETLGIGEMKRHALDDSLHDVLGVIGPILIDEIDKYIRETNHNDDVHSLKISHIGKFSCGKR